MITKSEDRTNQDEMELVLGSALEIMSGLLVWLVESGVSYADFIAALRPLFYNTAFLKKQQCGVRSNGGDQSPIHSSIPVSLPAQIVGLWLYQNLPRKIPLMGEFDSFESLIEKTLTDFSPEWMLQELEKLGIVYVEQEQVYLQTVNFMPVAYTPESKKLFTENMCDHLAAGLANLKYGDTFLEQAVFADELTLQSVEYLKQRGNQLWAEMSKQMLTLAFELYQKDKGKPEATQRFRLGIYQYQSEQ